MSIFQAAGIKGWKYILPLVGAGIIAIALSFDIAPFEKPYVPEELLQARERGAVISESIVANSKTSVETLKRIRTEEVSGNYESAMDIVLEEIKRNEKAREEALELSYELAHMTERLGEVRPEEAAQAGLQATIHAAQVTQRLINYNTYTYQLLELLRSHFATGDGTNDAAIALQVQSLVDKMNIEAEAINTLNEEYKKAMLEFDTLTNA